MKNKKGELTSNQLITIIILIISFAIILSFFLMLGLSSTIDKESCRNSVVLKGAIPIFKDIISLKCKTQDICFSRGGNCDSKAKDLVTVDVKDDDKLVEEMDNLINECWWMMGEGKVDYGGKGSCAICHRVYFDDKIKEGKEFSFKNSMINPEEVYVIVTGIIGDSQNPPVFVKFSSNDLKSIGCTKFVTEI